MSARTISPLEISRNKNRQLSNQLADANRQYQKASSAAAKAKDQAQKREKEHRKQMQHREQHFTAVVNNLQSDFLNAERRHGQEVNWLNNRINENADQMARELQQTERRNAAKLADHRKHFEQQMVKQKSNFNKKVADLKTKMGREFSKQRKEYINLVKAEERARKELMRQQREEYLEITDNQRQEYLDITNNQRAEYLEIAEEHGKRIENLNQEINKLHVSEENRRKISLDRIGDLKLILDYIKDHTPHEKFAPNELKKLQADLDEAISNYKNGLYQAAISTIYTTYKNSVNLREKIRIAEAEHEHWYQLTLKEFDEVVELICNKTVTVDKKERDINHWTNDDYGKLETLVRQKRSQLIDEKANLDTKDVQQFFREIEQHRTEQKELVDKAIQRVVASGHREKMAITIVNELYKSGYTVIDDNGYETDDPTKAYMLKIRSSTNTGATEIAVVINPVDQDGIKNILSISSNDHFQDDEARRLRAEELAEKLKQHGIEVGATECKDGHIKEFEGEQFSRIRKEGMTEALKSKLS